jgi:serine palmitoyltransferase
MPALLAVSASEGIAVLRNTPSVLATLQENVRAARTILDRAEGIVVPSHETSPLIHINLAQSLGAPQEEERVLQEIVEEALTQGVMITRAKGLRSQDMHPNATRSSIRLSLTSALTKKETEKAASVVKSAVAKVLSRRR